MAIKINGEIHAFLYEKISEAIEIGLPLPEIDEDIINGLNKDKVLRDYQIESLQYTMHYVNNMLKSKQLHLLYHMATGSGKTLIMAALILFFYKKGYNTFVFFVNNNNIIEKTKDNFLNKSSKKYLFNNRILIDNKQVNINEIKTFKDVKDDNINIMFTTVQSLHDNLGLVKENQISFDDFENNKVILLADEAHHLNSETKNKKSKAEELDISSWEYTIYQILACNKLSGLLEFTATPDFRDELIVKKYLDKVIYNYDLLKFRKDGYTKNFDNYQSSNDDIHRLLLAMLMSQYRKKMFAKNKNDVKPVILAKCKTTEARDQFIDKFYYFLKNKISISDIENLEKTADGYARKMFDYFEKNNISFQDLIDEIKLDFDEEHFITMDSSMPLTLLQEKNQLVNDLENLENPYRLIIVVDMLNEGWDVLNLYDIVRLYEDRDSKGNKIGKSTIQEAQLIGRGVRYYPFVFEEKHEAIFNKRKYDDDIENENRICETLLFHSKTDSKYLYELKEALKQQGMDIDDKVTFDYLVKDKFKMSDMYKYGVIFANEQLVTPTTSTKVPNNFKFIMERSFTKNDSQVSLSDDSRIDNVKLDSYITTYIIKDLAKDNYKLVYKAFRDSFISFDVLKEYIPTVKSAEEFILNDDYIGDFKIQINSNYEIPLTSETYETLKDFFYKLKKKFESWKETTTGSKEFKEIQIKEWVKDTRREKIHPDTYGEGISQNSENMISKYKLDLSDYDWFVYNDNYGTTEEKSFVKYFSTIVDKIREKYSEVYLIRNERNMHIYSFDEGGRFEPDYVLILKNIKSSDSYEQKQLFIESKGDPFLDSDQWKEEFLKQIEEQSIINVYKYQKNNKYSIIGLPFYNENNRMDEFDKAINDAIMQEFVKESIIID